MSDLLATGSTVEVRDSGGNVVDEYTIEGLHARGGQGFVYRLSDPDGEAAVLKVPSVPGLLASEVEVRVLTALPPHPNMIRLIGTATLQGVQCAVFGWAFENPYLRLNQPYHKVATKRFRGIAPRTPLPATTAVEMVQEVLAALEHLHRHSFVHADIKPANVLVHLGSKETWLSNKDYFSAVQQRAYRTLLTDMGSVRSLEFLASKGETDEQLAPSEFTPVFAPPEVFVPGEQRLGLGVDVYQVGLLLYQLITGYIPYEHHLPSVARGGLTQDLIDIKRKEAAGGLSPFDSETLRAARHQDVVFAEAFASMRLRDRFYEDVEAVIVRAINPNPDERPRAARLRRDVIRMFEMIPQKRPRSDGRPQVTLYNPCWHLTRVNRLGAAARVPDPPRSEVAPLDPFGETEQVKPRSQGGASTERIPGAASAQRPPGKRTGSERLQATQLTAALSSFASTAEPHLEMGARQPAPARARPEAEGDPLRGLRVALVDDDKLVLAVLGRTLRSRGCRVRAFQDPEHALEEISRELPDLAIVDMQMPVLDGLALIKELAVRLNGQPYPLVVLSSVEDEDVLKEAYRYGVQDYLIKPVTEGELAVKLEEALRKHSERAAPGLPRELGGFELRERVRRGGLAEVYVAHDLWGRAPDPRVWIKVLRPDLAGDPEPLLQLRREIDLIAGCDHPGVVRPFETGLEGRFLYFVTDRFPQRTLAMEIRDSGAMDEGDVRGLLRDIAGALGHLHDQAVVVGDLTPASLGRSRGGAFMICELGRARWAVPVVRQDEVSLPRSRYSAPELLAAPPTLEFSADLYSLGVCALEACSGKPAVRDRRSGAFDLERLCEGVSPELRAVLERLTADDLRARYADAGELLDALKRG